MQANIIAPNAFSQDTNKTLSVIIRSEDSIAVIAMDRNAVNSRFIDYA